MQILRFLVIKHRNNRDNRRKEKLPDYSWLVYKLNETDPVFKLDHSTQFFNSILKTLHQKYKVPIKKLLFFIRKSNKKVTLKEILEEFREYLSPR